MFKNFGKMLNVLILGAHADKFLTSLNNFLKNLSDFRRALIENHFPVSIISLIYAPIIFFVLFLNCLR